MSNRSLCYCAHAMSDHDSFLKARFCLSVLRTAGISPLEEARRLIDALSSEFPTKATSRDVEIAERDAMAALYVLHERFADRSAAAVAGEWTGASEAVMRWADAAGARRAPGH